MRAPYIDRGDTKLCTGCSACAYACPTGAIAMSEDDCGFVYPAVNEEKCVDCGRCLHACHMAASGELKSKGEPETYGAYVTDRDQLMRSASGGMATAMALKTVEAGGVAYGCVADRDDVCHERLATPEDVELSRGSKYVQSDISGAIPQIAADLETGAGVTFIGTPCQCAALRRLFGDRNNLLLVDLVCEGVPSQRMYADFLDDLERKRGEHITDFRFRDKRGGWSTKNAVVVGEGGRPLDRQPHSYHYYYWLFTHALILRDSCYTCPYACAQRVGDVTVGDFWGVETANLGYRSSEVKGGISCVLVSTLRGGEMFSVLRGDLDARPASFEIIARSNSCLVRPSSCDGEIRARILNSYLEFGAKGMKTSYRDLFGLCERATTALFTRIPLAIRIALKQLKAIRSGARRVQQ